MMPYCLMPPRGRLLRAMVGLAPAILGTLFSISAHAGQVWLAGVDTVVAADRRRLGMPSADAAANDFMELFEPNAPWQKTAAAIQIFKVSTRS